MINWLKNNKGKVLIIGAAIGCALFAFLVIMCGWSIADLKEYLLEWVEEIKTWPAILFFLAMVILPLVGFPISPLILVASLRFGIAWGIPFCMTALAVNFIASYCLCTKVLHGPIEKMLKRWDYSIPKIKTNNAIRWVLLVRISGVPLVVQNYTLGLAHPPFWSYLWVSLAVQGLFVAGFVVLGDSFMSGKAGTAIGAVVILVIATLLISLLKKHYAKPKSGTVPDPEG